MQYPVNNFDFCGPPPIFGTRYENFLCAKILVNLKTPQTQHSKLPLRTYFIRKNHNANQSLLKSIYKDVYLLDEWIAKILKKNFHGDFSR